MTYQLQSTSIHFKLLPPAFVVSNGVCVENLLAFNVDNGFLVHMVDFRKKFAP
jgi:hypothetical protein